VTSQVQVLHQACTAREVRDRDEALRRWSGYLKTRLGGAGCGAAARGRRGSLGLVGGVFGCLEGLEGSIVAAVFCFEVWGGSGALRRSFCTKKRRIWSSNKEVMSC